MCHTCITNKEGNKMTQQIKATTIGIGTGNRVHLTSAIVDGDKVEIQPSRCGSIAFAHNKSVAYGYNFSEGFAFDGKFPTRQETYKAETELAEELLASSFACSKCAKHAQKLLEEKVGA